MAIITKAENRFCCLLFLWKIMFFSEFSDEQKVNNS